MVFKLEISRDASTYYPVDLFPNQQLQYDVDFYDSLDVDKIKLPFATTLKIPLTETNKSLTRFNYDPLVSTAADFPKDDFFFEITIFGSSNVVIEGILNVSSFEYLSDEPYIDVDLKDFVSKYISDLKDATLADIYESNPGTYGTYFVTDQPLASFLSNEGGLIGVNPVDSPIIFPYIDFCNDIDGKYGYAARQFTEYGVGMDRAGIVPSYSVKNFLTAIGDYLTANGFNTRVDSKLFGLNYAPFIADMQPEKLQMLIPSKLQADKDTNTRDFFLRQAPYWTGTNENLYGETDLNNNTKVIKSNWFWNMESFGNYGPYNTDPEDPFNTIPITAQTQFGLDVTNDAYPENEAFGNERGYFAPFMSYNADINYRSGKAFADVPEVNFEIPILAEDKLVYQITTVDPDSTMTFGIFVGIYENGEMVKKLRLQDINGSPIVLDISNSTAVKGLSNKTDDSGTTGKHFFYRNDFVVFSTLSYPDVKDMLQWDLVDLGLNELYLPEETIEVSGESRYGVNYFIEPIEGTLLGRVATNTINGGIGFRYATAVQDIVYGVSDIRKAITRIDQYGQLNISITANENFNPYFIDDVCNLRDSIENTATMTPYEVLVAVCKRFGCGLFYEYDSTFNKNVLRVDPLHIVRNGSQNINELIDDLKSVKVYLGGDKIKDLSINNEDYGLYFDDENNDDITIGSTTQEINPDGVSDLEIDLKSSIYYNSVCGEALFRADNENLINGIVSEKEVAFTPNLFTKHQEIGLRFAYVDKPLYYTKIKIPRVVNSEHRPNIFTITQRIYEDLTTHIFNGRLFHYNTAGWNLMAEDEDKLTTDYYNLFIANEKIRFSNSPTIEFDMVLPTSDLSSLDFFFQTLSATRINQSSIVVKSAEGEVFENYAYLTIKGLLQ